MEKPVIKNTALAYVLLIALWLAAFKSADIFGFFKNYSSLWFLPAGVTLAIVLAVPKRLMLAPLIANLMLAIPLVPALLQTEFTNSREPILHGIRLYVIYGGVGLLLRYGIGIKLPVATLVNNHWILGLSGIAAAIATVSGIYLHVMVGNFSWDVGLDIMRAWGVGDAIGVVIVPPLLVPLLLHWFGEQSDEPNQGSWQWPNQWNWPGLQSLAIQIVIIALAMAVGFLAPQYYPEFSGLWYIILLPPIFFALRGGTPYAATSIFLTTMFAPPAAYYLGYDGERLSLQFLLLVSSVVGLTIGAAICDRRRAYLELKQSEHNLEIQVKERTHQLEEANNFQRHLVRSLGHDLQQPVQALNIMLDGLSLEMKDRPEAKSLAQAKSVSQSASQFISKILEFARRDTGDYKAHITEVSLEQVFELLSATYGPIAGAKQIKLEFDQTDLWIMSDETLLIEALSNLIDNSVRLSIKNQTVHLQAHQTEHLIRIEVIDQIKGVSGKGHKQSGFGLEIVTQICALMGHQFDRKANCATIIVGCSKTQNFRDETFE